MIYQTKHTNSRQSFWKNKSLRLFLVSVFALIIIFLFNISSGFKSFAKDSFLTFFSLGDYFQLNIFQIPKSFSSKSSIVDENIKLSNELEIMRLSVLDQEVIKAENDRLHIELGLKPIGSFVSSKIVARSPQIPLDSLLVDKGINDGVGKNNLILVSGRVLVGKIVDVSKSNATVVLNSSPDLVSYGHVERTYEPLELVGIGGGSLKARVPIDFDIKINDKIILEGNRAYLLAVVKVIEENHASGFKDILMSLPADIAKTRVVFIENTTND